MPELEPSGQVEIELLHSGSKISGWKLRGVCDRDGAKPLVDCLEEVDKLLQQTFCDKMEKLCELSPKI